MCNLLAVWDLAKTLNFSEPQIPPGYIFLILEKLSNISGGKKSLEFSVEKKLA